MLAIRGAAATVSALLCITGGFLFQMGPKVRAEQGRLYEGLLEVARAPLPWEVEELVETNRWVTIFAIETNDLAKLSLKVPTVSVAAPLYIKYTPWKILLVEGVGYLMFAVGAIFLAYSLGLFNRRHRQEPTTTGSRERRNGTGP